MSNKIRKGSLVSVAPSDKGSNGGVGFVQKHKRKRKDDSDDEAVTVVDSQSTAPDQTTLVDVQYTIDNRCSQDVSSDRVSHAMLEPTARLRRGDQTARPSLLSTRHDPQLQASLIAVTTEGPTPDECTLVSSPGPPTFSTAFLLDLCGNKNKQNIAFEIIAKRYDKCDAGWLRKLEYKTNKSTTLDSRYKPNLPSGQRQPYLSPSEKQLACMLHFALNSHDYKTRYLAHAWGITSWTLRNWMKNFRKNPLPQQRKTRSDKGLTLLTSEKKRQSTWTTRFVFLKDYSVKHKDSTATEAMDAWKAIEDDEEAIAPFEALRDEWLQQGAFLLPEIKHRLQLTGGSVSWETIATMVAGPGNPQPISAGAIRRFCMSLPKSSYKSTRIIPALNQASIDRRYWWSIQFSIFWRSAKTFNHVQLIVVHMDEKWFWSIVVRRNKKSIPMLGIEPVIHSVQHKNHLEKTMAIVAVGFVPKDNDWMKGGDGFTVSLVRAGRKVKASRNTYRRVYRDDGSFHYPALPENILRKKGELYFKSMEITGSSRGTVKDPKFSLLHDFYDAKHLPNLDVLADHVRSTRGNHCRVVVLEQSDNAGPHCEATLKAFLEDEYESRGWYLAPQPANSPITNVLDDCIFPAMSKHVSREQGISNRSDIYSNDAIWHSVLKCWQDFPSDVIARAFIRHRQIVNAIAADHGGDHFVKKDSLHCNVRNCCVSTYNEDGDATGVEMLTVYGQEDRFPTLRYDPPEITQSLLHTNLERMSSYQLEKLMEWMPQDHEWFPDVAGAYGIVREREDEDFEDGEVETDEEL